MIDEFWRGKRVLITGHTGFKGGWLAIWLQEMGAEVVGFSLAPETAPNLFEVADVSAGMTSAFGDIRDLNGMIEFVDRHRPEIIFHLAAQALVRASYADPVDTYATNIMGTVHVLEAARQAGGVRAVVVVTSDKCYENREWLWGYREYEPMGGHDPYSSSKGAAELVVSAYRRSFFQSGSDDAGEYPAVASARAGNVIGGGDWSEDRLVPDAMRAFMESVPLVIRSPDSTRPWQHVLDPLNGYLVLAQRLWESGDDFAEGWNFGPSGDGLVPVREVVERLTQLWGEGATWKPDEGSHPHEAVSLQLDSAKARHRLPWEARIPLSEGLAWTVDWYRAYGEGQDMRALTASQIEAFVTGGRDAL